MIEDGREAQGVKTFFHAFTYLEVSVSLLLWRMMSSFFVFRAVDPFLISEPMRVPCTMIEKTSRRNFPV